MLTSITSRLSALTTMYSTPPQEEHLLLILPLPKPTALLDSLSKKHPHLKITYHQHPPSPSSTLTSESQTPTTPSSLSPSSPSSIPDSLFSTATILTTISILPPTPDLAKNLKFIHLISAGSDHIQKSRIWKETDVVFTNSSGIHGPMISEWVVLQMLSFSHRVRVFLGWQKEHFWGGHGDLGDRSDWVGQRIGVLGYGSIGRQVAVVAKAMGMEVYAYTASPRPTPESKKDNGYIVPGTGDKDGSIPNKWFSGIDTPSLHAFLSSNLDILLISVPLTSNTTHLISTPELTLLSSPGSSPSKRTLGGTFIINISRGAIIDQVALEKFLEEGRLRGAALDVTDPEPLPKDSGLWDLEGVSVTPHVSGLSLAYLSRSLQVLERNLGNLEGGRGLINVVDRKKGY